MCVASMIFDHYADKWNRPPFTFPNQLPNQPQINPGLPDQETQRKIAEMMNPVPAISAAEIAEFRELLRKAREYDKQHNQPDCGIEEKKETLKKLAEQLGVDISFVDEAKP